MPQELVSQSHVSYSDYTRPTAPLISVPTIGSKGVGGCHRKHPIFFFNKWRCVGLSLLLLLWRYIQQIVDLWGGASILLNTKKKELSNVFSSCLYSREGTRASPIKFYLMVLISYMLTISDCPVQHEVPGASGDIMDEYTNQWENR